MNKLTSYNSKEKDEKIVREPMMGYSTNSSMDVFLNSIQQDVLASAIEFAMAEHRAERCVSHTHIDSIVKERMGWK
jgi:hypothetical protein